MKTLYLHIGRGKTGTTAIQGYLSARRQELLAAGVDYLRPEGTGPAGGHQAFAKSFIARLPDYMEPPPEGDIRGRMARAIADSTAPACLISSENFPLADIAALGAWVRGLAVPVSVRVIFFVRSQDELAESEYNQMVKLKRVTCSLAEYAETRLEGVDYAAECAAWAAVFGAGNLLCRIFDAAAGDAVARFLSCLPVRPGLPAPAPGSDPAYANRSLGARALMVARLLNGVRIEDREALYARLFAAFEGHDLPALLFSAAEARAFRARFADSNARFSERYLGRSLPDLGGRRHSDADRDRLFAAAARLF